MLKQKRIYIWVGKTLAKILKASVYGFLSSRDPSFSYFIMSYVMAKIRKKTWWSRDPEAVAKRHSVKKVLLEIWQNSLENTCSRVSFLIKLQNEACNFIKKETLAQVFSCEFFETSRNTWSYRKPPVAPFGDLTLQRDGKTNKTIFIGHLC